MKHGIAETAKEHLQQWDAGKVVWSIEMGGLGPGYEQAIQILAIEMIRDNIDRPLPTIDAELRIWGDSTVERIDNSCGGFSSAQVGVAKQIAFHILRDGPIKTLKSVADDRKIQVSNFWPRVP